MIGEILNPANYRTSLLAVPTLITAATMLALGLMVLIGERHSRGSISFFIMTVAAALWLSSYSLMYSATASSVAAVWSAIGHIGIVFIPASVYHFALASIGAYNRHKRRVLLIWQISAAFALAMLSSDAFIGGVRRFWWGYYPIYHWMGTLFIGFFFALMALTLREYRRAYRNASPGVGKLRNQGLLSAFCIGYLGSFDYLPAYGVPLYPFGYLPVLGFVLLADRTIRRYRLVDITPEFAAKQIIDAMDDALLVLDSDGVVRVVNGSACRLFSRSESELEGAPLAALAQTLTPLTDTLVRAALEGKLRNHECAARGGATVLSLSSFVMQAPDGNPMAIVCLLRDVTNEKSAQRQIERHTARQAALYELNLAATSTLELRAVLDVLLERLAVLVPDTAVTILLIGDSNESLRRVACRGIDEVAWQSEPPFGPAPLHPVLETQDAVFVSDLGSADRELNAAYFIRGGFRSYLGLPLLIKNRVIGILSLFCREERRYGEEEINFLRSLAGQAAVAIHNSQLYEQSSRQAAALEQANLVKEDFLGMMSHELRTPLNVISGYTRLVEEGVMGEVNTEQKKALEKVGRHADELLFMVNSIMNATKIEAGALSVDWESFPLADFLDSLRLLYDYPLGKPVCLSWDYPGDLPLLHSDRDKLKHVLQNLINNAIKFTDEGSVTLSARSCDDRKRVELTVSDTGIGIPPEDLPTIFDRFRQIDNSRTRTYGGVGLGLHIVKTFTELLGGTLSVASKPGKGSRFTITLPCARRQSIAANPPPKR